MNSLIKKIRTGVVVAFALLATAACSDGKINLVGEVNPDAGAPVKPVIALWQASPESIAAGGAVTLKWDVSGADEVYIQGVGEEGKFTYPSTKQAAISGEVEVSAITESTVFEISAIKHGSSEDPEAKVEDAVARATTRVEVSAVDLIVGLVNVPADELGRSLLVWDSKPADLELTTVIESSTAAESIVAYAACDLNIDEILATPQVDPIPSNGCTVVEPEVATTYTITITDNVGNTASDAVTIEPLMEEALAVEIYINGETDAKVDSHEVGFSVAWSVNKPEAFVTVSTLNKVPVECDPALPQGALAEDFAAREHLCMLSPDQESASFKIQANTLEGDPVEAVATVTVENVAPPVEKGPAKLKISVAPWAFVGEEVMVEIEPASSEDAARLKEVRVDGAASETHAVDASGASVAVVTGKSGISVTSIAADGSEMAYPNIITAIDTSLISLGSGEKAVTSVAIDPQDPSVMYHGVQMGGADKVRVYSNGGAADIGLKSAIKSVPRFSKTNDPFFAALGDYPLSALAVRGEQVFAGMTGAFMLSSDSGKSFKIIDVMPRLKSGGYRGKNPTCKGQKQKAVKKGVLVSLGRVCDIIAEEEGRILIATDIGVYTIRNIDEYKDPTGGEKVSYIGHPGTKNRMDNAKKHGFLTYYKQAHDLEKCGGNYFAATSGGIFRSENGETWEEFADAGSEAYALACDQGAGRIFAGTADGGISVSSYKQPSWKEVGSAGDAVMSLVVDPYSPDKSRTIIAGTSSGAFVSRNGGKNFGAVPGLDEVAVSAVALNATAAKGNKVDYGIMIGSAAGTLSETEQVTFHATAQPAKSSEEEAPEEAPEEEEVPEEDEEAPEEEAPEEESAE